MTRPHKRVDEIPDEILSKIMSGVSLDAVRQVSSHWYKLGNDDGTCRGRLGEMGFDVNNRVGMNWCEIHDFIVKYKSYENALVHAAKADKPNIVELLLPKVNESRWSWISDAFTQAARSGYSSVVKLLLPRVRMFTLAYEMRMAAGDGNDAIVRLLMPFIKDEHYIGSALQDAADEGHARVVEMLLPRVTDRIYIDYALQGAAYYGHVMVVKTLLPYAGDLEIALHQAQEAGDHEIERILTQHIQR